MNFNPLEKVLKKETPKNNIRLLNNNEQPILESSNGSEFGIDNSTQPSHTKRLNNENKKLDISLLWSFSDEEILAHYEERFIKKNNKISDDGLSIKSLKEFPIEEEEEKKIDSKVGLQYDKLNLPCDFLIPLSKEIEMSQCCPICLDEFQDKQKFSFNECLHEFHVECLEEYILLELKKGTISIKCPFSSCKSPICISDIREILNLSKPQVIFEQITFRIFHGKYTYCPTRFCNYKITLGNQQKFNCAFCQKTYCLKCKTLWHHNYSCREIQEWNQYKNLLNAYSKKQKTSNFLRDTDSVLTSALKIRSTNPQVHSSSKKNSVPKKKQMIDLITPLNTKAKIKDQDPLPGPSKEIRPQTASVSSQKIPIPSQSSNKLRSKLKAVRSICSAESSRKFELKPKEKEDLVFMKFAKLMKYRRCPNCKYFIEKTDGCNSMICSQCETNFCYACGILKTICRCKA